MGIGRRGSGSHQGPASLRTGAGRPPSGRRAQVHGEFGDCYFNTEVVLRWGKRVSPEEGASEGSKWLLGGDDPSGAGESKFLGRVAVSGFLFLLSWAALLCSPLLQSFFSDCFQRQSCFALGFSLLQMQLVSFLFLCVCCGGDPHHCFPHLLYPGYYAPPHR